MNGICKFCGQKSINTRKTLYGISICNKCHALLKEHDIKKDSENLSQEIQEYINNLKTLAPSKIKTKRNVYIRDGFRTYCIPAHIVNNRNGTSYSKTERAIIQGSFLKKILAFFAPYFYRRLLNNETREIIDSELRESAEEIRRLEQEREEKTEKENKIKIEKYVKRKILNKYPGRYRRIIERIKKEDILLYEYYLDEYPPDWEYRAKVVKERDKNTCQKCGSNIDLCVHHKIPIKKPDSATLTRYSFSEKRMRRARLRKSDHFLDNLITLCKNCHLKEHPSILKKINVSIKI